MSIIVVLRYFLWDLLLETDSVCKETDSKECFSIKIGPEGKLRDAEVSTIAADTKEGVNIRMALIRISSLETDILITMNRQANMDFGKFRKLLMSFRIDNWDLII
jgi:hypothetical protein